MVEIIAVAVYGVICFFGGWVARERVAEQRLNQIMEHVSEHVQDEVKKSVLHIKIEHHNGMYYVYNLKDHSFMAQGSTREELEKSLASKYPEKSFAATHENLLEVGFVNESV